MRMRSRHAVFVPFKTSLSLADMPARNGGVTAAILPICLIGIQRLYSKPVANVGLSSPLTSNRRSDSD